MQVMESGMPPPARVPAATRHRSAWTFMSYFVVLLALGLLSATMTSQGPWTTGLVDFTKALPVGDPASFGSGALDIARHGWFTPGNIWLIRLWPPGFMVLEGWVLRLVGETGPFLVPLLVASCLCCAAWMMLLRAYLLRSGARVRTATLLPLVPFAFPLTSFFLLSPIGLAFGETFALSLYLCGCMLALLAFRAASGRRAAALAVASGVAIAGAAYFRSQFELLVLFLTLGAGALVAVTALVFLVKRRLWVDPRVFLVVGASLVAAHGTMAPWRLHNYLISGSASWVSTSVLVYENALRPEEHLRSVGGGFVVRGGGHLACKLEPRFCGQKDSIYFYRSFLNNMGSWIAYKVQLLPDYWMAPPRPDAMSTPGAEPTPLQDAANLVLMAALVAALWRLWTIRRDPVFPLQAWLLLSLYGCLVAVYTMVHLETRYLYLPKIFSVVALLALLAPRAERNASARAAPAPRAAAGTIQGAP
jgi:hypothetical protein